MGTPSAPSGSVPGKFMYGYITRVQQYLIDIAAKANQALGIIKTFKYIAVVIGSYSY